MSLARYRELENHDLRSQECDRVLSLKNVAEKNVHELITSFRSQKLTPLFDRKLQCSTTGEKKRENKCRLIIRGSERFIVASSS